MITAIIGIIIVILVAICVLSVLKVRKIDRGLEESFEKDMKEIQENYNGEDI